MNPNLNEPKAWMQINFSSLLSKSQSFDEVSYRKAKRMRLFYDQKSVCDELKEKQSPLNLDPTAVVDLYNNPAGYYLNQVNPVNDISPMPDSDMSSPLRVKDLVDEERIVHRTPTPVTADPLQNDHSCINEGSGDCSNLALHPNQETLVAEAIALMNEIALPNAGKPQVYKPCAIKSENHIQTSDDQTIQFSTLLQNRSNQPYRNTSPAQLLAAKTKIPGYYGKTYPAYFDAWFELEQILNARLYSGFQQFFAVVKEKFPFIEQVKRRDQIMNWFVNRLYKTAIPIIPEKVLVRKGDSNLPFLKQPSEKVKDNRMGSNFITSAASSATATTNETVPLENDTLEIPPVPKDFNWTAEILSEFDSGQYKTATAFANAFVGKFPFVLSFQTRVQIRNCFTRLKQKRTQRSAPSKSSSAEVSLNTAEISAPEGFDYQQEFQSEFDTGKYATAAPFFQAINAKFPFILKLKTKKQIFSWYNGKKYALKKQKIDAISLPSSALVDNKCSSSVMKTDLNASDLVSIPNGIGDNSNYAMKRSSAISPLLDLDTANLEQQVCQISPTSQKLSNIKTYGMAGTQATKDFIAALEPTNSLISLPATKSSTLEQIVPTFDMSEHSDFFNTPSMKFLDDFFEKTLFDD